MKNLNSLSRIIFLLVLTCSALSLRGQQQGQYSQYMMNYFLINPGAAGTESAIDLRAGYRKQWVGLSGAPRNYYVSGHIPINRMEGRGVGSRYKRRTSYHVLGGIFSAQSLGALTHSTGYLSYAYHLPVTEKWTMSMGAIAGFNRFAVDRNALDFGDYIPDQAVANVNSTWFDVGAGLWMYSDKIFLGLSSMQMLEPRSKEVEGTTSGSQLKRLFYFTGGYRIRINEYYSIIPSLLLKQSITAFQADINTKVRYRDFLWAGISYRRIDAIAFLVGAGVPLGEVKRGKDLVPRLELGYSYDYNTSRLHNYNSGSHEIVVALVIPMKSKIYCPSHFW